MTAPRVARASVAAAPPSRVPADPSGGTTSSTEREVLARLDAARGTLASAARTRLALWTATGALTGAVVAVSWRHVSPASSSSVGLAVALAAVGGAIAWGAARLASGGAVPRGAARRSDALGTAADPWTPVSVALWLEARHPALRHALVTLADPRAREGAPRTVRELLAARVAAERWAPTVRDHVRRALVAPAAGLAVAGALLATALLLPASERVAGAARAATVPAGRAAAGPPVAVDPLARVRLRVTPPAYTGRPVATAALGGSVDALVGSTLELEGEGAPGDVRATLLAVAPAPDAAPAGGLAAPSADAAGAAGGPGAASAPVGGTPPAATAPRAARPAAAAPVAVRARAGGGWRLALAMPVAPAALRLVRAADTTAPARLVVLAPRADRAPTLALALPARDSVLRTPTGTLPLRATLDDDLGLVSGAFEYIVSSGEGESFRFRSGTLAARRLAGAVRATLSGGADLAALGLQPGDVVHLRAVARDANPRGAPGTSETRTLRIARPGEYDSVAVAGAPPMLGDTAALSQRMLLQLTEALARRAAGRPPLARTEVVRESRRIAMDQARLRKRVSELVFQRAGGSDEGGEHAHFAGDGHAHSADDPSAQRQLTPEELLAAASRATGGGAGSTLEKEGDEAPIVAVNQPLLEAYNAMWDAGRALELGEPRTAIPPMRRAIAAIQRARNAERVYLRGRPPAVVVDLARVRLAGGVRGDTLRPAARDAAFGALAPAARDRAASLDRALAALAAGDGRAAADTLALLRVRALADAPALAAALDAALGALAAGRDATDALVRARRAAHAGGVSLPAAAGGAWGGTLAPLAPARPAAGGTR